MRIVIISEWFSEKMGYAENYLPKTLGKLGYDVHVITTDLQVYATSSDYEKVYEKHLGPKQVATGIFKKDFFTLHRNPHTLTKGLGIANLEEKLAALKPDVVYCFEIFMPDTMLCVSVKDKYGFKLFCESRQHLSVYTPPKTFKQKINQLKVIAKGRIMAKKIDKFYPVAPDVFTVITKYFGIPKRKCEIASLAVDTDIFSHGYSNIAIEELRNKLGYTLSDIVCLYTGRFTESKGPLILAQAINALHEKGHTNFKGLFVGQGDDVYQQNILNQKGCSIHPFISANELPLFYNAFNIGVWPLQESTSQLDAAACGMPIIINEKVEDNFRIEGNGLKYKDKNYNDLAEQILSLKDVAKRKQMGAIGSKKIAEHYSWDYLAKKKLIDFKAIYN
ncbi:MAG: glycosyltransferase family 4 protein [Bacteroidetes bacterium]|nr:glycosyltransferase family 4 protein [Bacteroidota bacterium]